MVTNPHIRLPLSAAGPLLPLQTTVPTVPGLRVCFSQTGKAVQQFGATFAQPGCTTQHSILAGSAF